MYVAVEPLDRPPTETLPEAGFGSAGHRSRRKRRNEEDNAEDNDEELR